MIVTWSKLPIEEKAFHTPIRPHSSLIPITDDEMCCRLSQYWREQIELRLMLSVVHAYTAYGIRWLYHSQPQQAQWIYHDFWICLNLAIIYSLFGYNVVIRHGNVCFRVFRNIAQHIHTHTHNICILYLYGMTDIRMMHFHSIRYICWLLLLFFSPQCCAHSFAFKSRALFWKQSTALYHTHTRSMIVEEMRMKRKYTQKW